LLRALAPDASARRLPSRRHAFTHFTLQFTPHVVRIAQPRSTAMQPRMQWLARDEIQTAALATPIRSLLLEVMPAAGSGTAARAP
jgi:adenine-specific DNA glycosylase